MAMYDDATVCDLEDMNDMEEIALDSGFAVSFSSETDLMAEENEYDNLKKNYKRILDSQVELELQLELEYDLELENFTKFYTDVQQIRNLPDKQQLQIDLYHNLSRNNNKGYGKESINLNLNDYPYQQVQYSKEEDNLNDMKSSNSFNINTFNQMDLFSKEYHQRWRKNDYHKNAKITKLTFEECNIAEKVAAISASKLPMASLKFDYTIIEMGIQLQYNKRLIKDKETEIEHLQQYFRNCLEMEENMDNVHEFSLNFNHSIHQRTADLIALKSQQQILENHLNSLLQLYCENLHRTKVNKIIDNVKCRFDLLNLKAKYDSQQQELRELHLHNEELIKYKKDNSQQLDGIKNDLKYLNNELRTDRKQYEFLKDSCQTIQIHMQQLLEVANSKKKCKQYHSESDSMRQLRNDLQIYVKRTFDLANKLENIQLNLQQVMEENRYLKNYYSFVTRQTQIPICNDNSSNCIDSNANAGQISKATVKSSLLPVNNSIGYNSTNRSSDELTLLRFEQLLKENEVLKQQLFEKTVKVTEFELTANIQENIFKCENIEQLLDEQQQIIEKYQKKLLINDSKLYKMEKNTPNDTSDCSDDMQTVQVDNQRLKQELQHQINHKLQYQKQLQHEQIVVAELQMRLNSLTGKRLIVESKATQTDLPLSDNQINELKANVAELELRLGSFHETDAAHKQERLKLLKKLIEVQDSKILFMQQNQKDWEDILSSLHEAQTKGEHLKHELELKRMELEHLNEIFAEQNKELRKFEKFAIALENKRLHENIALRQSFHNKIHVLQQRLIYLSEQLMAHQGRDKDIAQDEADVNMQLIKSRNKSKQPTDVFEHLEDNLALNTLVQTSGTKQPDIIERLESIKGKLKEIKEFNLTTTTLKTNSDGIQTDKNDDNFCSIRHILPNDDKPKASHFDQLFTSLVDNVEVLLKSLYKNVTMDSDLAVAKQSKGMKFYPADHTFDGDLACAETNSTAHNIYDTANYISNPNLMDDHKRLQQVTASAINLTLLNDNYVNMECLVHPNIQEIQDF